MRTARMPTVLVLAAATRSALIAGGGRVSQVSGRGGLGPGLPTRERTHPLTQTYPSPPLDITTPC